MWSVTWLDFYPNVSFSYKVATNQSRTLPASQLFPFFHSPHIHSETKTSKYVTSKHFFRRISTVGNISEVIPQSIFQIIILRLIDWLIDWLTDWLIDWLTDWLIDWLIDWLFDWWIDWSGNSCKNKNATAHRAEISSSMAIFSTKVGRVLRAVDFSFFGWLELCCTSKREKARKKIARVHCQQHSWL